MEDNEIIHLELTIQEVNNVLRSLGRHPFDEIASLIGKIKAQGDAQVAEMAQAAEQPSTTSNDK